MKQKAPKPPDIHAIMVRFYRALALIIVAHRSLDAEDEDATATEECIALKEGIAKLKEVYNELDLAAMQLGKNSSDP